MKSFSKRNTYNKKAIRLEFGATVAAGDHMTSFNVLSTAFLSSERLLANSTAMVMKMIVVAIKSS